jgi:hypothetical protein
MKNAQLPMMEEPSAPNKRNSNTPSRFEGTANPRHLRVLHAALVRARKREEVDRIAGASNGPELVAELRRRGLEFPCSRVPGFDRDGLPIRFGVYHLTDADRRKLAAWMREGGAHD